MALVAFLEEAAASLAGCSILFDMASNNSLAAITRGDSNTAAIDGPVARVWGITQRFHIRAWFSRAPSEINPAEWAIPLSDAAVPDASRCAQGANPAAQEARHQAFVT